jgi:hypothetical protein
MCAICVYIIGEHVLQLAYDLLATGRAHARCRETRQAVHTTSRRAKPLLREVFTRCVFVYTKIPELVVIYGQLQDGPSGYAVGPGSAVSPRTPRDCMRGPRGL